MNCPLCHHPHFIDFFTIAKVPVTCASVFGSPAEARALPGGRIDLACCERCGFVFNRSFDPKLGEIGARYESSQAASARFSEFARSLARDWIERYGLAGKTVLEVGCGGGDFLRQLTACGVGMAIGIDPLVDPANPHGSNVRLIAQSFDDAQLQLAAEALVCRHTLEHIQDVRSFLLLLRRWCEEKPDRILLFELPDAARVFSERAFWDIYYEHCNYFTADTVRAAFEFAGLEVLRIARVYDDQYLIVEAKLGKQRPEIDAQAALPIPLAEYRQFANQVRVSIDTCQATMEKLRAKQAPLVLWQGAAKTVGFMSSLPGPDVVDAAIDLSPHRQGRFLPGSGLPVYASVELTKLKPMFVVLMNPVYLNEVRTLIRDLGLDVTVYPVNALLDGSISA